MEKNTGLSKDEIVLASALVLSVVIMMVLAFIVEDQRKDLKRADEKLIALGHDRDRYKNAYNELSNTMDTLKNQIAAGYVCKSCKDIEALILNSNKQSGITPYDNDDERKGDGV